MNQCTDYITPVAHAITTADGRRHGPDGEPAACRPNGGWRPPGGGATMGPDGRDRERLEQMRRLYIAADLTEARLVADLLEAAGIEVEIFNQFASGALGELPFTEVAPEIWLREETDEAQARRLVAEFASRPREPETRFCPHCHTANPETFAICWRCGEAMEADT